ncbi:putative paraquat-inducible protein A [Bradyrhizobium sp. USDA 3240]
MIDTRLSRMDFKPVRGQWTKVAVGMSLGELFALGITGKAINHRLYQRTLSFQPLLSPGEVTRAYRSAVPSTYTRERRKQLATEQHEQRWANKTPRSCMCCNKVFPSEGRHNRVCQSCKDREARNYCPW